MTLKDLIDVSEVPLIIYEGRSYFSLLTLNGVNRYSSDDFKDVLTPKMLDRRVIAIKAENGCISVNLEVVNDD